MQINRVIEQSSSVNLPIPDAVRHDWQREEVTDLFAEPLMDLLMRAQTVHRQYFPPNKVQISSLLSIKTGGCPEDCAYCPQSVHHNTGLEAAKLMQVETVVGEARKAKQAGATRFCMAGRGAVRKIAIWMSYAQ